MKAVTAVITIIRVAMDQLSVSRSVNEGSPVFLDCSLSLSSLEFYELEMIEVSARRYFSHCTGMS